MGNLALDTCCLLYTSDTVFDCAEGTLYVEFCPDCQIVSMQHQQT